MKAACSSNQFSSLNALWCTLWTIVISCLKYTVAGQKCSFFHAILRAWFLVSVVRLPFFWREQLGVTLNVRAHMTENCVAGPANYCTYTGWYNLRYGALHFGQRTLNKISLKPMGGISKSGVHLEAVTFTYNLLTFGAVSFYKNKGRNVKVQATPPLEKHTV